MNKSGIIAGRKVIFYIMFGIILAIVGVLIASISVSNISVITEIPNGLQEYIFTQRFLNSQDCFTYFDLDTGRVYPGVIEWEEFRNDSLEYCYNLNSTKVRAFELTLEHSNESRTIQTPNWHGFPKSIVTKDVLVYTENKFVKGKLSIGVEYG